MSQLPDGCSSNTVGNLPMPRKIEAMSADKIAAYLLGAFGLFVVGLIIYCVVVF